MLSTNDKTIKLWRMKISTKRQYESSRKAVSKGELRIPASKIVSEDWEATVRRTFSNAHNYHINSLSQSPDGEHFLSSDDLRVNVWNAELNTVSFSIVDIKPPNIDDLNEVITHAEFHPLIPDLFLTSSSKGMIHMCDIRQNSLFEKCATKFEIFIDPAKKHFFSEIINSISSATFSKDGMYIYSRDYLSVKVWDVRNQQKPVRSLQVTDYMEKKLCDLYESESVFDKFELRASPCSNYVLTGAYNNNAHVIDVEGNANVTLEASFNHKRAKQCGHVRYYGGKKLQALSSTPPNLGRKVMQCDWHPHENIVAIANHNCIFLLNEEKKKG